MSPTLHPIIEEHREGIIALCREFGVAKLEVFGSAATGAFDPASSDIDFLVTYPPGYDFGPWLGRLQELEERLADLLKRPVDLVMAKPFRNPYFAKSVEESRRPIYVA
jgi:predicted nucleotidyltransferase